MLLMGGGQKPVPESNPGSRDNFPDHWVIFLCYFGGATTRGYRDCGPVHSGGRSVQPERPLKKVLYLQVFSGI